ncbi:MAG TPA: hypothetical protein VFS96_09495, partial [Nitrolancea sp.]|nr:hypothetical protein [Nitrolancea sp.]
RAVADPPDGRFTFNPLGASLPLFNRPRTETEITQLAAEEHVPDYLRRRPLYDELEALRQALTDARPPRTRYFGSQPVLEVFIRKTGEETFVEIPPEKILICDLRDTATGDWRRPPETKPYIRAADGATIDQPIDVAVDPVLGRLAFRANYTDFPEATVEVNYAYGFSGDLGGGPYNRRSSVRSWLDPLNHPPTLQIGVTQDRELLDAPANTGQLVETVAAAIDAWHDYLNENPDVHEPFGLIAVMDSRSYDQPLPEIQIPANGKLVIASADWPELDDPDTPGQKRRIPGQIIAEDRRAHLASDVTVLGTAGAAGVDAGELVLDGLLIEGAVTVVAGNLGRLRIAHCTLVPDKGGLSVVAGNPRLTISLDRSMSGEITVPNLVPRLSIIDSIVDGTGGSAIVAHGCGGDIQTSTLFGEVALSSLEAGNSIFTGRVTAIRRQIGCVRFCFLPFDSLTPRRYLCQPAEAASEARVFPRFTSVTFGEPGYGQLRLPGQPEITAGAEDEGELGAFHFLQTGKRLRNLQTNLDDYLRFGLEAGVLFGN